MEIRHIKNSDINDMLKLFNEYTNRTDFLYEKLDINLFKQKFLESTSSYDIYTFVAETKDKLLGFSSGIYDKNQKKAYITMVIVDEKHQRQGIGSKLLNVLEKSLLERPLTHKRIEMVFFNPINLSWVVPHTKAVHPNAPGVDKDSGAYHFFKQHKYMDFAIQNVYYMDIRNYEYSQKTKEVIESVEQKGFKFDYFNIEKDFGLEALLEDLGSPVWKKVILEHVNDKKEANTLLVPTMNHQVAGFTGPLLVEDNQRGYFAGIGTHSAFRGLGLGKALFAKLVMGLKQMGAGYMTLFTGENNPARRMYEKEGFKIVRTFIDLRKEDF